MSTKWALVKTIQCEPDNKLACFAMADLLEEEGWLDLAFCYRWMGWYDRRPGKREGKEVERLIVEEATRKGLEVGPTDQVQAEPSAEKAKVRKRRIC